MRDEADRWVLDEDFVRGGVHEPAARTREAIARYGGKQTSWRQPGVPAGAQQRRRRAGNVERQLGRASGRGRARRRAAAWAVALLGSVVALMTLLAWTGHGGTSAQRLLIPGVAGGGRVITSSAPLASATPDPPGNVVRGISPTTPVGTCFTSSAPDPAGRQPLKLRDVDCAGLHNFQLVSIDQAAGSSLNYPTDAYWQGSVAPACQQDLAAFTRSAAASLPAGQIISFFRPTESGWSIGDRTVYASFTRRRRSRAAPNTDRPSAASATDNTPSNERAPTPKVSAGS